MNNNLSTATLNVNWDRFQSAHPEIAKQLLEECRLSEIRRVQTIDPVLQTSADLAYLAVLQHEGEEKGDGSEGGEAVIEFQNAEGRWESYAGPFIDRATAEAFELPVGITHIDGTPVLYRIR